MSGREPRGGAVSTAGEGDTDQSEVFAFLADPRNWGASGPLERADTHGAVVFLGADKALKVKRAVAFPFMDFSTLDKRHAASSTRSRSTAPTRRASISRSSRSCAAPTAASVSAARASRSNGRC